VINLRGVGEEKLYRFCTFMNRSVHFHGETHLFCISFNVKTRANKEMKEKWIETIDWRRTHHLW